MTSTREIKTALVHHWLATARGGEQVLEALAELFPSADLFTLVCDPRSLPPRLVGRSIHTSFLQRLPRATRWYPHYLPLFPLATERLDLRRYQLVISSDAATMKGVRLEPDALQICYCHSPMRYVWSGYETYRRAAGPLARLALPLVASWLRRWDFRAAQRVTHFVANSQNVAARIRRYYCRESAVIYPPVDTETFRLSPETRDRSEYFLLVSQLVPYKRVDVAVDAFNRSGKALVIIGEGSECRKLQRRAKPNIQFLGNQPRESVRRAMQESRALIFPGEEDFGIVMAEAHACGTPVIAFGRGGAREIVSEGTTGIFFDEQSPDSLLEGLARFDRTRFDSDLLRASALRFRRERFLHEFATFVDRALEALPSSPSLALARAAPPATASAAG